MRTSGLHVRSAVFGEQRYSVQAHPSPEDVGPVDFVLLGVKAHALPRVAPSVEPLKGTNTAFVSTQNGLPWWYFHGVAGNEDPIRTIDPDGLTARHIPPAMAVGSIVYFSCSLNGPGELEHTSGNRLPLGEPVGGRSERVLALSEAFRSGGIKAPIRNDIRHELWVKLLGNAALNPLSALTRKPLYALLASADGVRLIEIMMDEIREVASAAGIQIAISNERRLAGLQNAGQHRTSMLQDLDRGREPELDALLGSIIELAERNHVSVPSLVAIHAATKALFSAPEA